MSKTMLPIAAALFSFYAAVALLGGSAGGQAAVVEHTFVVSREMHIYALVLSGMQPIEIDFFIFKILE